MQLRRRSILCAVALSCVIACKSTRAQAPAVDLKYSFGARAVPGYVSVSPTSLYSDQNGFGFEAGAQLATAGGGSTLTSSHRFLFSAKVPEGNYTVTVTFGDPGVPTTTTIKAEAGRLMLERVQVPAGSVAERSFTTNVRTARLPKLPLNATGREEVSLDQFDRGNALDWDDKLCIEVVSPHPALRTLEIASAATSMPTVYLAGDSTVTDRDGGPDVSWGQLLPRFFQPGVAIANEAQSGETLKSFANALRLDKILSQIKKGDYLFLQFAHNDSKQNWPQTYVDPATTYKDYLRVYIDEARLRGAIPVLVTPMDRGARGTGAPAHGHGAYPDAMREVAREEHVALIDLYAMSIAFYNAAGADAAKILADGTHSTAYGGYEFAKCIVMGIKQNKLPLASLVVEDFKDFNPAKPDSAAALDLDPLFTSEPSRSRPAAIPGGQRSEGHQAQPADPGPGPM